IGESGTGLVALVPAHGGSDGPIAAGLGIPATSVLDPETARIFHGSAKYSDLPVEVADSVIVHDLIEGNHLFAELRVQRGVPHCAVCGSEIIWAPARAWCLEPGRMAEASVAQFSRRLPNDPVPVGLESVPWPVSEARPSEGTSEPSLWECEECEELDSSPEPSAPSCDHDRAEVRRSLLPGFRESLETWIRIAPLDPNDSVHLFTAERRKVPTVVYHLVAMEAAGVQPENVGLSVLSTVPSVRGTEEHRIGESFDAYRAAVLRTSDRPANGWTLQLTRVQEDRRLRKLWNLIGRLTDEMAAAGYRPEPDPVTVDVSALLPEDAAFLSVFEVARSEAIKRLDGGRWSAAQELLVQFFEREFRGGYLALTRTRRDDPQWTQGKRSFYRTVMHVLERWLELFAPVAPFVSEEVAQRLRPSAPSIFDRPRYPILQSLIRPELDRQYRQWSSIARAIDRARRTAHIPFSAVPRTFAVLSDTDEIANELEKEGSVLVRMSRSPTIQYGSPSRPWPGRTLSSRFLLPEIRAAYPGMEQRIARTLAQLPAHRLQEGVTSGSLEIMLDGQPIPIRPNMIEFREAIPAGSSAAPWRSGEIVIEWSDPPLPDAGQRPLLSLGADRLVQGIERSLRSRNAQPAPEEVVVWADPKLADEIDRNALRLAEVLGVGRLRLVPSGEGFPTSQRRTGRSPEGPRWAYWIPSLRLAERRQKSRVRQRGPRRFEMPPVPNEGHDAETDRTESERRSKEAAIRSMVDGIDAVLGVPWVGPAKIGYAWEAGLRSADEVLGAPYERLAPIPGFGPWLASEVIRHRGDPAPHRSAWAVASEPEPARHPTSSQDGPPLDAVVSDPTTMGVADGTERAARPELGEILRVDVGPAGLDEPPPVGPAPSQEIDRSGEVPAPSDPFGPALGVA
ncbi:MAG: class I tRNA ligase family protein, partial [Thermoplasmata archaeon]